MPTAIINCADQGPCESLAFMLNRIGWEAYIPDESMLTVLRDAGCDTVLSPEGLVKSWGYEMPRVPRISHDMDQCDAFFDLKAHRNRDKILSVFPQWKNKIGWYRINGGEVEIHLTQEFLPGVPIVTPNAWYKFRADAYWMWPPFVEGHNRESEARFDYHERTGDPICLIHNLKGWGHLDVAEKLGGVVKCYGGSSPDGLIPHEKIWGTLGNAKAMVHLKSNDCPGYALYEAIYSGCPVILSRKLIWRMRQSDLWIEGETCLCYDVPGHQPRTERESALCAEEILCQLERLSRDKTLGTKIACKAFERLKSLEWPSNSGVESFRSFMQKHFGG